VQENRTVGHAGMLCYGAGGSGKTFLRVDFHGGSDYSFFGLLFLDLSP